MQSKNTSETTQDLRREQLSDCFAENYIAYQYALVEFFAEHLSDVSRSFGGDLEQVMVVAILGQRRLAVLRGGTPEDPSSTQGMSISASRLADATGIPRETVRRKLALLKDRGWAVQGADGSWALAADETSAGSLVRRDLAELDLRARRRVARLVAALERLELR